jgi:hypothetical protein
MLPPGMSIDTEVELDYRRSRHVGGTDGCHLNVVAATQCTPFVALSPAHDLPNEFGALTKINDSSSFAGGELHC